MNWKYSLELTGAKAWLAVGALGLLSVIGLIAVVYVVTLAWKVMTRL
jgi:hypothetical protein